MKERWPKTERHDSMRGWFAWELYQQMRRSKDIWVIVGDLGFAMFDRIRADFPERFLNTGAAEQAMMDIACGLALEGKKPFVYSITTFLLFRPFETIRNYINREQIPVRLVGSGWEHDYSHDGYSHWPEEGEAIMKIFSNITSLYPKAKEEIPEMVEQMVKVDKPWFIALRR